MSFIDGANDDIVCQKIWQQVEQPPMFSQTFGPFWESEQLFFFCYCNLLLMAVAEAVRSLVGFGENWSWHGHNCWYTACHDSWRIGWMTKRRSRICSEMRILRWRVQWQSVFLGAWDVATVGDKLGNTVANWWEIQLVIPRWQMWTYYEARQWQGRLFSTFAVFVAFAMATDLLLLLLR